MSEQAKLSANEPVAIHSAVTIATAVVAMAGSQIPQMWAQVAVYILAGLIFVGSTAWARQHVQPFYKATDWLVDTIGAGNAQPPVGRAAHRADSSPPSSSITEQ